LLCLRAFRIRRKSNLRSFLEDAMNRWLTSAQGRMLALPIAAIVLLAPTLSAFIPSQHFVVTLEVLAGIPAITRTIEGHTLRFSPDAIQQIVSANTGQDLGAVRCIFSGGLLGPGGPFADSSNHFDDENLTEASQLAIDRLEDARKALLRPSPQGWTARRLLGQVLHAAQDYYAHSNWIETASGPDGRLGTGVIGPVASGQTCEAPPNAGTYVSFFGFTSGYWLGCDGRNDSQLPVGKCYHGWELPPNAHAGTNNDKPGRPKFQEAKEAAKATTRSIIDQLLDANGIAGNLERTAALMGYRTIAFAVDITASMTEELPFVKSSIQDTVQAAIASGDTPGYVLVTFEDTIVSEPFITADSGKFLAKVNSLNPVGNADCPESSGAGILKAVRASVPGSTVYTFTDASAKDPANVLAALERGYRSDIRIQARLTGSCSPIDPVYKQMTAETGDQLFVVQPGELPSLTPLTTPQISGNFQPLLVANGVLAGTPRTFAVSLDPSVGRVVFSASVETAPAVSVTRPDGTVVSPGSPGVTINTFSTGAIVTVQTPVAGSWTVSVNGTGEYSIAAHGNTPVSASFRFVDYVDVKHPGFFEIQGQPFTGQPGMALGRVAGTTAAVTFDAVSLDGAPLGTLPLATGHPDAASGDYTGTFTPPSVSFRVVVRGLETGFQFQRMVPTVFRAQVVRVLEDSVPESVLPGTQSTASFFVWNGGPAANFDITARDERGFVTGVSPQTLSLPQNSIGSVQVTLLPPPGNPATGSPATTIQLTLSAAVQGQPEATNSAFVDVEVKSVPPADPQATYYLHSESSPVTWGARYLKTTPADSPPLVLTSGNLKGKNPPWDGTYGSWDTATGVPGFEGVIPSGSVVTVTLWMKKTTNWGRVFPHATMKLNDFWGTFFCEAT
jgi:hypothetical protein